MFPISPCFFHGDQAPIGTAAPRSSARSTPCRRSCRRSRDAWAKRSRSAACLGRNGESHGFFWGKMCVLYCFFEMDDMESDRWFIDILMIYWWFIDDLLVKHDGSSIASSCVGVLPLIYLWKRPLCPYDHHLFIYWTQSCFPWLSWSARW